MLDEVIKNLKGRPLADMQAIAAESGISQRTLYLLLSEPDPNPRWKTVLRLYQTFEQHPDLRQAA